jgi:hypothetical protein
MHDETPTTRLPDLAAELDMFNEERRRMLRGKPIDPGGDEMLMPEDRRE